jgi:hypothetical protein
MKKTSAPTPSYDMRVVAVLVLIIIDKEFQRHVTALKGVTARLVHILH